MNRLCVIFEVTHRFETFSTTFVFAKPGPNVVLMRQNVIFKVLLLLELLITAVKSARKLSFVTLEVPVELAFGNKLFVETDRALVFFQLFLHYFLLSSIRTEMVKIWFFLYVRRCFVHSCSALLTTWNQLTKHVFNLFKLLLWLICFWFLRIVETFLCNVQTCEVILHLLLCFESLHAQGRFALKSIGFLNLEIVFVQFCRVAECWKADARSLHQTSNSTLVPKVGTSELCKRIWEIIVRIRGRILLGVAARIDKANKEHFWGKISAKLVTLGWNQRNLG